MKEKLIELGYTEREAELYLTLLALGDTTVGPLERRLGLHKQIIYNALEDLKREGLATVTVKNGRRHFRAADPDTLLERNVRRQELIETLLPDLYAHAGTTTRGNEIRIYEGEDAFRAFLLKMIKKAPQESVVPILGAGGEAFLRITRKKAFFERYENLRKDKKIQHLLLMYEQQRNTDPAYTVRRYVETRFLPETFVQPFAIQIWPDRISLALFDEVPRIIEVEGVQITNGFRNYFDILWKIGTK
ncbi:MAG: hypothetical protein HGA31_02085 [Candidatus Moranbacteria bacterium]|nr:hypothetical protein [Candidatus Moranbacteria bacterium]